MLRQLACVFVLLHCALAVLFCPEGYGSLEDRCYRFDPKVLATYEEALNNCASTNENLASIHDDDTNNYLKALDPDGVRIGLQYNSSTKSFTWSDNSPFDYDRTDLNFGAWSQYFGDCAVNENGIWKNSECEDKYKFVCVGRAPNSTDSGKCPDHSLTYATPVTITSPGYPGKYDLHDDRGNCVYKISAPTDHHIKIYFDELAFDENEGYLAVYKNYEDDFSFLEAENDIQGYNVIVENNVIILELIGSLEGKYKVTVTGVSPEPSPTPNNVCPDKYRIYPVPHTLLSPGYPNNFDLPDVKVQCIYLIAGKNDLNIKMYLEEITAKQDYGLMYGYTSWAEALSFGHYVDDYDKRSTGKSFNYTTKRFGLDMGHRTAGSFKIQFTAI